MDIPFEVSNSINWEEFQVPSPWSAKCRAVRGTLEVELESITGVRSSREFDYSKLYRYLPIGITVNGVVQVSTSDQRVPPKAGVQLNLQEHWSKRVHIVARVTDFDHEGDYGIA